MLQKKFLQKARRIKKTENIYDDLFSYAATSSSPLVLLKRKNHFYGLLLFFANEIKHKNFFVSRVFFSSFVWRNKNFYRDNKVNELLILVSQIDIKLLNKDFGFLLCDFLRIEINDKCN